MHDRGGAREHGRLEDVARQGPPEPAQLRQGALRGDGQGRHARCHSPAQIRFEDGGHPEGARAGGEAQRGRTGDGVRGAGVRRRFRAVHVRRPHRGGLGEPAQLGSIQRIVVRRAVRRGEEEGTKGGADRERGGARDLRCGVPGQEAEDGDGGREEEEAVATDRPRRGERRRRRE